MSNALVLDCDWEVVEPHNRNNWEYSEMQNCVLLVKSIYSRACASSYYDTRSKGQNSPKINARKWKFHSHDFRNNASIYKKKINAN